MAEKLGIPYHVVNFEKRFESHVVRPFVDEYMAGRTPIPCTLCNSAIKFDSFLDLAAGMGADRIATGHYARVERDAGSGRYLLRTAVDAGKDQTYFLFGLKQDQLARTLFPLGDFTKAEVRRMAEEMGLPVAQKSESQEICFVPDGGYSAFIDAYFREQGIPPSHYRRPDRCGGWTGFGRACGRSRLYHRAAQGPRASPPGNRST